MKSRMFLIPLVLAAATAIFGCQFVSEKPVGQLALVFSGHTLNGGRALSAGASSLDIT